MSETAGQHQEIEAYIQLRRLWIEDAVEAVSGDRTADPLDVFPAPPTERRAIADPGWDETTEASLRGIAARFGMGSEVDIPSGADEEIIDAGLAWKMESELEIAHGHLTLAGSKRTLTPDERVHLEHRYGKASEGVITEYELARFLASRAPDFEAFQEDVVLPLGYEVAPGYATIHEPTGQLVQIGSNRHGPVRLLLVEGYQGVDHQDKPRTYNPDGSVVMRLVSDLLKAQGDTDSSIGLVTSNTYGGSRTIDAVSAGLKNDRLFMVGMYGRQTLADIKGSAPAQASAGQLAGELHVTAERLLRLEAEWQTIKDGQAAES